MDKKKINWWLGGAGVSYPFLATIEARWTALGYTHPSATVKASLNTMLSDLSGYGVLTGFDALWVPMLNDAGIVSTTGTINYISPSVNQLTFPVAPTFTVSGFEGNGSSQYALTNFNPSIHGVNYTQNSASRGMYVYKLRTIATSYLDGHAASAGNLMSIAGFASIQRINNTGPNTNLDLTTDYMAINRPDASNVTVYKGTTPTSGAAASAALVNENLTILRSSAGYGDNGISFYYAGRSFSATEHGNIRTAFAAHKTRLGL